MKLESVESMQIDWDVPIEMDDGAIVYADVFRPAMPGKYPVILSHGVYGKGLPIQRFRHRLFQLVNTTPNKSVGDVFGADLADAVVPNTSMEIDEDDYRVWEVVNPTDWVPHGYVVVRVDSRGSGSSPGRLDPLCPREIEDYAACIEWSGVQSWSNGRVGLCGKSYYAMSQWLVAAKKPSHLAAICVWHGWSDWYRDATRHGGIMYQFWENFWYPQLALPVQHGIGPEAGFNPHSSRPIAGNTALDSDTLARNRADIVNDIRTHPFEDEHYYKVRTPQLDQITVPVLASADWSDHDLHLRGTIRGFEKISSKNKWLEIHAGGQFDDEASVDLQRRFFDYHLKETQNNWDDQSPVQLALRKADGSSATVEASAWPIPGTEWRPYYFDFSTHSLEINEPAAASQVSYKADGDGVTVYSQAMTEDTTIVGPVSAALWMSSTTADADLFLVLNAVGPDGELVELRDHRAGLTPMTVGWLRASHRALDPERSTPWQPYHTHTSSEPLVPGQIYKVDVELRPTSLLLPAGYRLCLTIKGNGPAHNDPVDRPAQIFNNTVTVYNAPDMKSQLLIPVVPMHNDHLGENL
ncbi:MULTISPECIES: CocE/NonD family hydrolase [Paenibacillus]|uniref:Peptidase S15 n=1 Tax=Paenibacillus albilobatus TaxID=2716884 RepID=A0A919XDL5_9BACL|nr:MULTISPECIES: CocE/NonD family hydrolase [Paenibacillus]GIO29714.1 peptidase S15 [Paenibacillus albilobatus]